MSNQTRIPPIKQTRKPDLSRRFTDEQVWAIRQRILNGETKASIAREFNVSNTCIIDVAYGKNTYKDV